MTWPGLSEVFIIKNIDKSIDTTMENLQLRRQVLKSTKKKPPDTDLDEKCKTDVVFCNTMDPSTTKEGEIYSNLCGCLPITPNKGNKYICDVCIRFYFHYGNCDEEQK